MVAATVQLDASTGRIATFTPAAPLQLNTTYTARIVGGASGVKDLAIPANELAADFTWDFTTAAAACTVLAAVPLNTIAPFGTFGGSAGMTNSGILSVINGDIGTTATATSSITGFHDTGGDTYTETLGANVGAVNGTDLHLHELHDRPDIRGAGPRSSARSPRRRVSTRKLPICNWRRMPPGADPGAQSRRRSRWLRVSTPRRRARSSSRAVTSRSTRRAMRTRCSCSRWRRR